MTILTATVSGLERFVGDIKRCYRTAPLTEDPEAAHERYHQSNGGTLVASGLIAPFEMPALVDQLEADDRILFAYFVTTPSGQVSYRVYEP